METLRQDYTISTPELKSVLDMSPQGIHHILKSSKIDTFIKNNRKHISPLGIRKLLESRGYKYKKEVISFSVVKGGVGKTSLSHSFAIRASQYGARVLCVDLDQQGNLSQAFGIDPTDHYTIFDYIKKEEKICLDEAIIPITNNLHLIPSNMNISFLDRYLQLTNAALHRVLKEIFDEVKDRYDYIIQDCPPAISSVTAASILASDRIIIPITPSKFAIEGLKATIEEATSLSDKFQKPNLAFNILFNRYDARKSSSNDFLRLVMGHPIYKDLLLNSFIRENIELENCINKKQSVFDNVKKSFSREDIDLLTQEIMGLDIVSNNKEQ